MKNTIHPAQLLLLIGALCATAACTHTADHKGKSGGLKIFADACLFQALGF
jgi:hypothetical protein